MPRVTEAIQNFIRVKRPTHNAPELLDRWNPFMETQVNVAADNGEPVDGKRNTYTDGEYTWFNIRIPKNAAGEPEFKDYDLRCPLELHIEGLGWTGWDWQARKSRAWGFDFDAITSHAKGIGVSDEELERVKQAAMSLPYVEVRKSTSGSGIHLYVYFDDAGVATENHTVHAALGRCILGMASADCGFDFASHIDACGGNMWLWHRKMSAQNGGLSIIKPAETVLSLADLPANWRDHIDVIKRRCAKIRVSGVSDIELDPFEALTSSRRIVPLDDQHKDILDDLRQSGFSTIWVPDHHLCQTHTCALAKVAGKYTGIFRTNSEGKHPQTPNCFMFPMDKGGWKVFRFSPGVQEDETWNQDREGWTTCFFNRKPSLATAAKAMGGVEDEKGGYGFTTLADTKKAAELLGEKIKLEGFDERPATLKKHKDGRLVVELERSESDAPLTGYLAKPNKFVKIFDTVTEQKEESTTCMDNDIRKVVTPNGDAGWRMKTDGVWRVTPYNDTKIHLQNSGYSKTDAEIALGGAVKWPWQLVHLPFQPEYPGDRRWNLNAPQFRYQPVILDGDETPNHPHWDKVFDHFFGSLTKPLQKLQWAKDAGIRTGGDYGRRWAACLFREPFEPLPYIFAYGPEGSGKSILHEALSKLVTSGITMADRVLSTKGDFNGELENTILAVIEEVDISKHPDARAKIKDWTTSKTLSVRRMRTDSFQQQSTLHFLQLSNLFHSCPVFQNDTRIMVVEVPPFKWEGIPKKEMLENLKEEAPHFMRTLMDIKLPAPLDRLQLPVVETTDKTELANEVDPVGRFLVEKCDMGKTKRIIKVSLHTVYNAWALENGFDQMTIADFGKQLRAVSKNEIRANGQMTDKKGKRKHCYEGVDLKPEKKKEQAAPKPKKKPAPKPKNKSKQHRNEGVSMTNAV